MPFLQKLDSSRLGDVYIFLAIFIFSWGSIASFGMMDLLGSALWALIFGQAGGAIILGALMTYRGRWQSFWTLDLIYGLLTAFTVAVLCLGLVFLGYQYTDSSSAAILGTAQVFFTLLIFSLAGQERVNGIGFIGMVIMLVGAYFLLFSNGTSFNIGNVLILVGLFLGSCADFFAVKARRSLTAGQLSFLRCAVGTLGLIPLAFWLDGAPGSVDLTIILASLAFGLVFFGFEKICWYEGIHRIPVTRAMTLSMLAPLLTVVYNTLFFDLIPTTSQLIGMVPLLLGALLIVNAKDGFTKTG